MGARSRVLQQVTEDPPTYVNAKQYRRIIKRREARAKLEARRKVAPQRKVGEMAAAVTAGGGGGLGDGLDDAAAFACVGYGVSEFMGMLEPF